LVSEESNRFTDWGSSVGGSGPGDVEELPLLAGAPLQRFRPVSRRLVLVASLALVLVVVAAVRWSTLGSSPGPPSATFASMPDPQGLFSRPFATVGPAGWSVSASFPASGVTDYQLTSSGSGMPESAVIPPPGTIEIQITNMSPAGVAGYLGPQAGSQTPLQLLSYFRRPTGAADVVRSEAPHRVTVAGVAAERDAYAYVYHGRRDVQTQLSLRKGATVIAVEVDAAPAIKPAAASALNVVLAHWVWYGPKHPAPAAPILPTPPAVAPAPSPIGQWIASGFVDSVGGDVANASLDEPEVRSWEFVRTCRPSTSCRTEIVRQLQYGGTIQAPLEQIRGSTWWRATFPVTNDSCAREPGRPTLKETNSDTINLGWSSLSNRHQLIADETQTIKGCGAPTPATIGNHWTATPVQQPATPAISPNRAHTASASAFRSAALRACTRVNNLAAPLAARIGTASGILRTTTSRAAKAAAEATIAAQLSAVPQLWAKQYSQIPQPPDGPLDTLWLQDLAANRQQLAPATAAISALRAAELAQSHYFATGHSLQLQTAIAEATLFAEDITKTGGSATRSNTLEHTLHLPAICINPPALTAIFTNPTLS